MNNGRKAKKRLSAPNISLKLDRSDGSLLSDELDESGELDLDGIDTPSDNSNEFEWEGEDLSERAWGLKIKGGPDLAAMFSALLRRRASG